MAASQSIFTGKQGWGLTHNEHTHTHIQVIQKVIVSGLHFVQHRFWFRGLQTQTRIHLTALDLSIFVYVYTFSLSYHKVNA